MTLTNTQKQSIGALLTSDMTAAADASDDIAGATIVAKTSSILYGQHWVDEVFSQLDESIVIDWYLGDGQTADADDVICKLVGPVQALSRGQHVALGFLQAMSVADGGDAAAEFAMLFKID